MGPRGERVFELPALGLSAGKKQAKERAFKLQLERRVGWKEK